MFGIPAAFIPVVLLFVVGVYFFSGVRVVRPTSRGLVERLGKYHRLAMPGFNWIIPGVDRMILVNITEVMVNAEPQEIITSDKLNARVDAQVYFKVKSDEESVKSLAVQRLRLPVPDGQPGQDDPAQHHRHADPQVREQRAREDQQRAAEDHAGGDERTGGSRSSGRS